MSLVGARIGNYVLERVLARGGMGEIYVARHPHLDRSVAVKILRRSGQPEDTLAARFFDEAKITAQLKHPHIVDLFDFGEFEGHLYYLMELLDGSDMCAYLAENGPLPFREAIEFLLQICEGLTCAHAAGAVHRDLKPANVFVQRGTPAVLKLMDFGIAKLSTLEGSITSHGQLLGTPAYMAPEQALGETGAITPRSDLYALGAIAYELLSGAPPFCHESPIMVLIHHVHEPPPPLIVPGVPAALSALIHRCLEKDPAARPTSAEAVAEELRRILTTDRPGDAPPAPSPEPEVLSVHPVALPFAEQERSVEPEPDRGDPSLAGSNATAPSTGARAAADAILEVSLSQDDKDVLKRLVARMQRRGDLPAFGANVGEVNARADYEGRYSAHELAETILKDCALTARLLRVVNSLHASRVAGRVYSVRQAIVILGFERVRSLAVSISVFCRDGIDKSPLAEESALMALTSGEIARETALKTGLVDPEQAMICGMFQSLGRHLILVYLPELYEQLREAMGRTGHSDDQASAQVLGISLRKLGLGVALKWNLPKRVTSSLSVECRLDQPVTEEHKLALVSHFSLDLSNLIARSDTQEGDREIEALVVRYGSILGLSNDDVRDLLARAGEALHMRHLSLLHRKYSGNPFLAKLEKLADPKASASRVAAAAPTSRERVRATDRSVKALRLGGNQPEPNILEPDRSVALLSQSSLATENPRRALEEALGLFERSFGATRVLVLGVPEAGSVLRVLGGSGPDVDSLRAFLTFDLKRGASDVFSRALSQERDVLIRDAFSKRSIAMIPRSYYEVIGSPCFHVYYVGKIRSHGVLILADIAEIFVDDADRLTVALDPLRATLTRALDGVGLERVNVRRDVEVVTAAL